MEMTFTCKEPGCEEKVAYKREVVFSLYTSRRANQSEEKLVVYLPCPEGHIHRYEIEGS